MSIRVFVFDDDELIRTTLSYFLIQEGYQVSEFAQPDHCSLYYEKDCICGAKQACADIIITDINMPGENGLSFIENQIQKGCKVGHIAVMSGDWEDPDLEKAKEIGCEVLYKPFSIVKLKNWLDSIRTDFSEKNDIRSVPVYIGDTKNAKKEQKSGMSRLNATKTTS